MCIAGLFGSQPKAPRKPAPPVAPPPPPPPVEPIKPAPPPEVIKKEPASIAPATGKRKKGLSIAGKTESPASGGVPLGIGANSGNKTINTGLA